LGQGEGFIIITGDIGTGKTLLVRTLFNELSDDDIVAGQLVTTQIGANDLVRMVSATFGLAHEGLDKATLLRNLEVFLRARNREGKRVLLVVDEVQNLPMDAVEELRMLSNFEVNGRSLLQSFLLGQEEFRAILQSDEMEQLRQRVIAAYHLSPLDMKECRAYIEHRLQRAGWKHDPAFTDEAYVAIHKATEGTPRRINGFCDRLMLYGYLEELHELTSAAVDAVAKEINEETVQPAAITNRAARTRAARIVGGQNQSAPVGSPLISADVEARLADMEEKIESLSNTLKKERKLLRKAILMSLELEDEDGID
jgi:type II secretory pathway predicted ATPase ExeA